MYSFLSGFVHSAWVFWDSSVLLCVNSSFVFNRWCVFYYMGIPSVVYPSPVLQHWSVFQGFFFNFLKKFYLLIYLWLCWVFVSVRGLSPVAESGGYSSSRRAGLSLSRPLLLRSTGSRRAGSVIVAHGPSRFAARGVLPDQGSNPRPRHRQADSQPLRHQGSSRFLLLQIQLLCTFMYQSLCGHMLCFPLSKYLSVEELHHLLGICSAFKETAKLFSKVFVPLHIFFSSVWEF